MAAGPGSKAIDAYIAAQTPEAGAILRKIRATVRAAAPGAQETLSYKIPAFTLHGALVYFAAFKHHIGFYPPVRGNATLQRALARYAGPKGNLKFPFDEPMPYGLITKIVKLRVKQNRAKAAARK